MSTAGLVRRYAWNDLQRNRGTMLALVLLFVLSALLMASGAVVLERLSGAVDRMFELSKPPHFLQMHRGEIDRAALGDFAQRHDQIEDWLVQEMLGFPSAVISWEHADGSERGDLSASMIDHLFVAQNDGFDLLLDEHDTAVDPAPGTVFVPVALARENGLGPGDELAVETASGTRSLEIAGTVRDAQMASSMSSSTRLLLAQEDLDRLRAAGGGASESLIEYRLEEGADTGSFQRDYEADTRLPHDGQAVTGAMIRLITVFSDGLIAIALMFASILLIGIAMLSIRFVIRSTIDDDVREIGALRAIGIPHRTIESLLLARYGAMAALGCAIGGVLSAFAAQPLTQGIRTNFASPPSTWLTFAAPGAAVLLVLATVLIVSGASLRRIRRLSVVDALVHGRADVPRRRRRAARGRAHASSRLAGATGRLLTLRLALADLLAQRRRWLLLPTVMCLGTLLVTLPAALLATFDNPRFTSYLGAPQSDLRSDVQFAAEDSAAATEAAASLLASLAADPRIDAVRPYATLREEAAGPEGWDTVGIEVGDHTQTDLKFRSGGAPAEDEVALSVLNADRLGVAVGDDLDLRGIGAAGGDAVVTHRVSGIYQDITSGGYTAKAQGAVPAESHRWTLYAQLSPGADPTVVASELNTEFPSAKTLAMQEYTAQTLGYATHALRTSALISTVFALLAIGLISVLFLRLAFGRDRTDLGVLTALGFSAGELASLIWMKTLIVSALGILAGGALASTVGSTLVSAALALSGTGISRLTLLPNPWISCLALPLLLLAASALGPLAYDRRLRAADRSSWLR
ncbi:ABC transporter permease [Brevibacterium album]|uniref:ABC transporter permease n=1 Tax=Brevibacterium album TaxID=417948 RepID=UPI000428F10D|nr:ABC transporter permease [Brevibacterium album]